MAPVPLSDARNLLLDMSVISTSYAQRGQGGIRDRLAQLSLVLNLKMLIHFVPDEDFGM
jgi:hypothetical protein